jgi:hypothetical protein
LEVKNKCHKDRATYLIGNNEGDQLSFPLFADNTKMGQATSTVVRKGSATKKEQPTLPLAPELSFEVIKKTRLSLGENMRRVGS